MPVRLQDDPVIAQDKGMANLATELPSLQSSRVRALVWPREHGAWGMLMVPLATGAAVGLRDTGHLAGVALFAIAALALFCLRVPVEVALAATPLRAQTSTEREAVVHFIGLYVGVTALALGLLFWIGYQRGLLAIGTASALAFGAQALLRKLGRSTRMAAQMAGAVGLASTAAGAYYVAVGRLDARAILLWGANWLFACNQIQFVQLRIHATRAATFGARLAQGWGFLLAEALSLAVLLGAWRAGWVTGWVVPAFAPAFGRGVAWFFERQKSLNVHRLGFTELAHAIIFGILLTAAFRAA